MNAEFTPPVKIREEVLAVPGYRQGKTPSKPGFKLSSNENPFAPAVGVTEAIEGVPVNRYGAAAMPELRGAIGELFGLDLDESQTGVHLGAGSVAILYQLIHAVAGPGDNFVYAWPSFEGYPLLGLSSGATPVAVALTGDAEHDLDAMVGRVSDRTRAVILCSPNNPTGPTVRAADFDRFMDRVPHDVLVILDEAYREFVTDESAVRGEDLFAQHENLVVLRTFSKAYGLASLRIGYGIGHPAIWRAAQSTSIPLSVTAQAEAAAKAALTPQAQADLATQISELISRREELVAGLRDLGLAVPAAQGNFVWLPFGALSTALGEAFAEAGTLVRPFDGEGVRISVGEQESIAEVHRVVAEFVRVHPELRQSELHMKGGV